MSQNFTNLSRADKILLVMHQMGKGARKNLKYEDIVVSAFKKFNEDFHLRGYEEYPDSGDLVHKPLYEFRKRGLVEANNKVFSLTNRGVAFAEQLLNLTKGKNLESNGRLSRSTEREVSRIEGLEGYSLFLSGENQRITESDFYSYLGVTPRTAKNDFLGRIETVAGAIAELKEKKNLQVGRQKIIAYNDFICNKFLSIISHFKPSRS